ncbi:MAG: DUF3822 family protein [Bacteroidales bacterium]|nr:DUF3822 family protein [Bacteroidales bacterium]
MSNYILHDRFLDPASGHISSYFCQLFILVGQDTFQYCILDTEKNKFIALVDFRLPSIPKTPEIMNSLIAGLISDDELLRKNYPSVLVGIDTPFHTLVPSSLFEPGQVSKYLEFNFRIPQGFHYMADRIAEIDAYNVSGIPADLKEMMAGHFSKAAFVHGSTPVIKATHQHYKTNPGPTQLFLNVRSKYIDLVMFNGNRPELFNSFPSQGKEDILYFTLFMIEQSALRPDQVQVCLGGMIDEGSELYQLLSQYLPGIGFCNRLNTFDYSAMLDHVPAHQYQDLFALALCGS